MTTQIQPNQVEAQMMPNRNAIINGGMDVWQRGTATLTNPVISTYFPDRFNAVHVIGDGTFNLLQSVETPSAGFPFQYSLQHDTTAAETAVAASELATLAYYIEGYDFKRFERQTATLSFWVKAVKTGIYCVAFRNNAANMAYVSEYTISSANTWEKKTITLTFNSGGTFLYTNGIGLRITWAIMCGTTRQIATANKNTWQAGDYWATDAQVNGMDNVANNFYLTGVQMELGSVATPFEQRPYATELALCQRYYEVGPFYQWRSPATSLQSFCWNHEFKVTKRTTPSSYVYSYGIGTAQNIRYRNTTDLPVTILTNAGAEGFGFYLTTAYSMTADDWLQWLWNASAEL